MPWAKGQSGNAKGYRKGRLHKTTAVVRKLVDADGPEIIAKIIKAAKDGDMAAQQLFMKHLWPKHRFVPSPIDLEPASSADEVMAQIAKLVSMCASGLLDLDSLRVLVDALKVVIDGRVAELEAIVRDIAEDDRQGGD